MRILLVGFGVVGQALARLLEERRAELYARHTFAPSVVGVLDSRGAAANPRGLDLEALIDAKREHGTIGALPVHGLQHMNEIEFIVESEAQVMIEATPTSLSDPAPAFARLKAALRSGKHVVCVNKGPLAVALPALLELARHNACELRFSGSVGGGTPMLKMAEECARGDRVDAVRAVVNGTTNFILWRMADQGEDYEAALAEAIRLGYAERDPSGDVDGIDSAAKLVILANGVLGRKCAFADVAITGIRGVTREQVARAQAEGKVIKLIASVDRELRVEPRAISKDSPLNVPANLNALCLTLGTGNEVTLVGPGAGGPATATAILRDLIDIWRSLGRGDGNTAAPRARLSPVETTLTDSRTIS